MADSEQFPQSFNELELIKAGYISHEDLAIIHAARKFLVVVAQNRARDPQLNAYMSNIDYIANFYSGQDKTEVIAFGYGLYYQDHPMAEDAEIL